MTKQNFDKKRTDALRAFHDARVKAAAKAKKDAERLANQVPVVDEVA
jgi:hypothetical protein